MKDIRTNYVFNITKTMQYFTTTCQHNTFFFLQIVEKNTKYEIKTKACWKGLITNTLQMLKRVSMFKVVTNLGYFV